MERKKENFFLKKDLRERQESEKIMKQVTSLLISMRIYCSSSDFRILIPSIAPNLPNMPNRTLGSYDA